MRGLTALLALVGRGSASFGVTEGAEDKIVDAAAVAHDGEAVTQALSQQVESTAASAPAPEHVARDAVNTSPECTGKCNSTMFNCTSVQNLCKIPKLSFLHIPKNAGSSVEVYGADVGFAWGCLHKNIRPLADGEQPSAAGQYMCDLHGQKFMKTTVPGFPGRVPAHRLTKTDAKRCPWWHIPSNFQQDDWFGYYKSPNVFAVIRDPVKRLISQFRYNEPGSEDVGMLNSYVTNMKANYANDCHTLPMWDYLVDQTGKLTVNHVLVLTPGRPSLECQMQALLTQVAGLSEKDLPKMKHLNSPGAVKWQRTDLTQKTLDHIHADWEKDEAIYSALNNSKLSVSVLASEKCDYAATAAQSASDLQLLKEVVGRLV